MRTSSIAKTTSPCGCPSAIATCADAVTDSPYTDSVELSVSVVLDGGADASAGTAGPTARTSTAADTADADREVGDMAEPYVAIRA